MSKIKQYCIWPQSFKLDGGAMYGIIPRPLWMKKSNPDESNRINLALRLWIIKLEGKVILTDTGVGDYHGETFDERFAVVNNEKSLEKSLSQINMKFDDITDLVLSHLHFDHVGGIGNFNQDKKFMSLFPKAILHVHKDHWDYANNPTQRDSGSFQKDFFVPIVEYYINNKQIKWHSGDEGILIDHPKNPLKFKCSNGHTPHMMHPYNNEYIYLADIIPTSNHIKIPWVMGYDIAPGQSTVDKEKILTFIYENKLKIIFEHDPKFWGCDIKLSDKGGFVLDNLYNAEEFKSVSL